VGSTAGPAVVEVITDQGKRVGAIPVRSNQYQVSDVVLFDHAAAIRFQVNFRNAAGDWAPGAQLSLTALNIVLGSLTPTDITNEVELVGVRSTR
jgi:hypothetical protein